MIRIMKKSKFLIIALGVFCLGAGGLISATAQQFNPNNQDRDYPLRVQRRLEATKSGGSYSYETNQASLPVDYQPNDIADQEAKAQEAIDKLNEENENKKDQ
jgi:hypothetical protein